jgi:hypothetical protein
LASHGPTLVVNIGFDPNYLIGKVPTPLITGIHALVDTGAVTSCIDSMLASQLNLPIVDKRTVSGIGGSQELNVYLAQIHVPSLNSTIYGDFTGVHLQAGGQPHKALIGRSFLQNYRLLYNGISGDVEISNENP